ATGTITASVTNSISANNGQSGFFVFTQAGKATTSLLLTRSAVANNGTGLLVSETAAATLRFGQSSITGNQQSWATGPGSVLQSLGDNYVAGNTLEIDVPTTITRK